MGETDPHPAGAIVANPGGLRWKIPMASALAEARLLRLYVAPLVGTEDRLRRAGRLPRPVGPRLSGLLALRPLPEHVAPAALREKGTLQHVAFTALHRVLRSPKLVERAEMEARACYDRGTAELVRAGDLAVIGAQGAAARTLDAARRVGVPAILDYPIAHHEVARRLLQDEARRVPEFSGTLQYSEFHPRLRATFEAEIAAADRILVLSTFARDSFIEAGVDPSRLVVTPLGVDVDAFHPDPEPRDDGTFRVLFAGQITQRKGISYLIDAFERAGIPNSELVFLGIPVGSSAPWRGRGIVHRPWAPITRLREEYVRADAYVLPSLVEGFPLTAILAMACGVPTIVSDHTFGSDVVSDGDNGFLVPIRDPDAIAERLRMLARDRARAREVGLAGRARASEFTWERYGRRIVDVVTHGW